ncbi:hypothetical protein BHE74_00036803 [Ensete ventricosum]|nr:hypothetical protein BHE74_00036803 [Ensete ventricosum]
MTVKMSYKPDMDPGSSLSIGPRFGQCDGSSSGVQLDFIEGIGKIARNMPGDRRRKTMRLAAGNAKGCRIMGVRSGRLRLGPLQERPHVARAACKGDRPRPGCLQGWSTAVGAACGRSPTDTSLVAKASSTSDRLRAQHPPAL